MAVPLDSIVDTSRYPIHLGTGSEERNKVVRELSKAYREEGVLRI